MLNGLPDSMSQLYLIPLIFSIGNPTYSKVILLSGCAALTVHTYTILFYMLVVVVFTVWFVSSQQPYIDTVSS